MSGVTWTAAQTAVVLSPVIAIFGAALVALLTYALNRRVARRDRRALAFGEALSVIEDYAEMPYRIRRRSGTLDGRQQLTEEVSRIYSRLAFHQALLDIEAPAVAAAYRLLANEAKAEVGEQMKVAWQKPVRTTDPEMNLEEHYTRVRVDVARDHCVAVMRAALGQGRFPVRPPAVTSSAGSAGRRSARPAASPSAQPPVIPIARPAAEPSKRSSLKPSAQPPAQGRPRDPGAGSDGAGPAQ
ncbi:hypothetical protein [Actinoplanes palleronii]|uniref:hypothetical protein n=1 Tax=Actinoplanes palleronii TaxID=113570 RepID=UPI001942CC58|nr:hypothetical protein [Actinoplanes palleronii]